MPDGRTKDFAKRRLQNQLLEKLLESIFLTVAIPEIKKEALAFINDICEHFAILELEEFVVEKLKSFNSFELEEHEGEPRIDPKSLMEPIMFALSHYNQAIKDAGAQAIHSIYNAGIAMVGSHHEILRFPLFRTLFGKLSHSCFEAEYYRKAGACLGMKILISDLSLPVSWLASRQMEFVRTMFFVLKDVPNDVPSAVRDQAGDLLLHVLKECNKDMTPEKMNDRPFKQLTGFLAYELANANDCVRKSSKEALRILSELCNTSVGELLNPVKAILLTPIFGKPLRALPFLNQIGYIDAITYCMGLKDTFLEFNDELTRLLLEALALVEAEDESLTSAHRIFEHRTAEQLVQLRIVSIRLLSLALTSTDNAAIQQTMTRSKIIAAFFKTLYSRSNKVVDAAFLGLSRVFSQNVKLPRELLQNGLRPILMNLSDYKKLTVAGLEGLARLLELLTSYFKVEIAKEVAGPFEGMGRAGTVTNKFYEDFDNAAQHQNYRRYFKHFSFITTHSPYFYADLMQTLLYLESNLRRQQTSPFREPIAKFLNRYPQETVNFFLPKISDRKYGRFFADILTFDSCDGLRKNVRECFDKFETQAFSAELSSQDKCVALCNMVYVVKALNKDDESWIVSQKKLLLDQLNSSIPDMVKAPTELALTSPLHLQVDQCLDEFQHLFLQYFKHVPDDHDSLFMLINSFCSQELKVSLDVNEYVFENIVASTNYDLRKSYLMKSIDTVGNKSYSLASRTFVFKHIINPILVVEGHRHGDLSNLLEKCLVTSKGNTWLDNVHAKIWRTSSTETSEEGFGTIDHYRLELLQMSALLIKLSPNLVADARKDIIKFGWSFIKLEDIVSKQAAYVLIAYFIAAFDTLSKIAVQIYVALLKTPQNEARSLVKQALDLMAPVLPKRVTTPLWAKWPRKVLSEEGHNVSQVLNVYHFLVRYPELFFDYRDHFIHYIIGALPKLGFVANASADYQTLAVDLMELIWTWERMANEKQSRQSTVPTNASSPTTGHKRKLSEIEGAEESISRDKQTPGQLPAMESICQSYSIPATQREACITYLIRFICNLNQKAVEVALGKRSLNILDRLLSEEHWSGVNVKLSFFERGLAQNDLSAPNSVLLCLNALEVVAVTLKRKTTSWIVENIQNLEKLFEKCIKFENIGKK